MKKWWPLGLFVVGLSIVLMYQYQKYRVAPKIDVFALDYSDTSGKNFNLNYLKGKKILYSFWGTWCGECVMEMKKLNEIKEKEFPDVTVVAVSDEPLELTMPFIHRKKYPFVFLQFDRTFHDIGIEAIPVNFFINEKGEVTYTKVGSIDWKDPSEVAFAKENLK